MRLMGSMKMSEDLIKRSDAIKAIEELPNAYNGWSDAYDKAYIIGTLEEVPSADRQQEWIPCSERLPKSHGYYICTCKDGSKYKRVSAVKWSNGWQLTGARAYWIVLAWMPLPEPWKGADDDR